MLTVNALNTFYGKAQILFDLSLEIATGEVVALIGRNGSGKSTLFKSIMNLLPDKNGKIIFKDQSITQLPTYQISKAGLGYVPEDRRIFKGLSVLENLEAGKQVARQKDAPWTPERLFGLFPNLAERRNHRGGALSGGEQQMLTIARTLMGNPELILLDEPFEGLAPLVVKELVGTIQHLKKEGISVLLAEQNLSLARYVCDRIYLIHQGSIRHESPVELLSNAQYETYCSI